MKSGVMEAVCWVAVQGAEVYPFAFLLVVGWHRQDRDLPPPCVGKPHCHLYLLAKGARHHYRVQGRPSSFCKNVNSYGLISAALNDRNL